MPVLRLERRGCVVIGEGRVVVGDFMAGYTQAEMESGKDMGWQAGGRSRHMVGRKRGLVPGMVFNEDQEAEQRATDDGRIDYIDEDDERHRRRQLLGEEPEWWVRSRPIGRGKRETR